MTNYQRIQFAYTYNVTICLLCFNDKHLKCEALIHSARPEKSKEMNVCFFYVERGCVKTPNINNKKLVVRSCVDVQRVFVFLRKGAL